MKKITLLYCLVFLTQCLLAQKGFTKIFHASLTPGLSTNGIHPGGYSNFISINLTSGYSSANFLMEAGIISNLNERETRGLQVGGISNVTGGNAFAGLLFKEIEKRKREGFEANLSGLQISGATNFVLDNIFGAQVTGGVNIGKGALHGFQLAGLSNTIIKYSFGVQLAGGYNVSAESMDGLQMAGVFNITTGGLYGVQISLINKAGFTEGINSLEADDPFGIQIGAVNIGGKVNGYQFGIVNISKRMQGTQVGLINIFGNGKTPETRDGTSIGLINIGSSGYLSVYTNDLFYTTVEVATGTLKNRRMNSDMKEKQFQNGLIYANDASFLSDHEHWALGYGVKKLYFNKSITPGLTRFNYFAFGFDFLHINHDAKKITKQLSLLTRPNFSVGSRLHPKNKVFFFFAGVAYNVYRSGSGSTFNSIFKRSSDETNTENGFQHWPGYSVGVLVQ